MWQKLEISSLSIWFIQQYQGKIKNSKKVAKVDVLEISDGKVKRIKCVVCSKYADYSKNMKVFSKMWIKSVKKDSLEKHIKSEPDKPASDLELKGS